MPDQTNTLASAGGGGSAAGKPEADVCPICLDHRDTYTSPSNFFSWNEIYFGLQEPDGQPLQCEAITMVAAVGHYMGMGILHFTLARNDGAYPTFLQLLRSRKHGLCYR